MMTTRYEKRNESASGSFAEITGSIVRTCTRRSAILLLSSPHKKCNSASEVYVVIQGGGEIDIDLAKFQTTHLPELPVLMQGVIVTYTLN